MKFWIGGAAKSATVAMVFCQLIVDGKSRGVHGFIVPLRSRASYETLPGITIGDCGAKIGHDGIDNGFIVFERVRVPKSALLNRLSDIDDDGNFSSSIKNDDARFGMALGGLSVGRIALSQMCLFRLAFALKIAIRFGCMRKQFGPPKSNAELTLLSYPLHQYRLFKYMAFHFSARNTSVWLMDNWEKL